MRGSNHAHSVVDIVTIVAHGLQSPSFCTLACPTSNKFFPPVSVVLLRSLGEDGLLTRKKKHGRTEASLPHLDTWP